MPSLAYGSTGVSEGHDDSTAWSKWGGLVRCGDEVAGASATTCNPRRSTLFSNSALCYRLGLSLFANLSLCMSCL